MSRKECIWIWVNFHLGSMLYQLVEVMLHDQSLDLELSGQLVEQEHLHLAEFDQHIQPH